MTEIESKNKEKRIGLASDTIPNYHLDDLSKWIKNYPRLTQGKKTKEFENVFSKFINTKDSTFVNSGSSANLLMATTNLFIPNLKNKKVAISSLSWATTVSPFIQLGYQPTLIDTDPKNLGINVDHLYKAIKNENIGTVIIVHVLGHNSTIDKVVDICQEFNVRLFEDCCQSLGSLINNKKLGSFGLASSFSFFYGHHISTIEGGCVCSDNFEFNQISKAIRSHGWGRNMDQNLVDNLKKKYNISDFRDSYTFYYPGYNIRSTDLNAYIGLLQMQILDKYCMKRNELFKYYLIELAEFWSQTSNTDFVSSFSFATLVENPDEVWSHLSSKNIECRPLISGSIGLQPYWIEYNGKATRLRYSDQVHSKGIYLPIHADLSLEDLKRVCFEFKQVAKPSFFE